MGVNKSGCQMKDISPVMSDKNNASSSCSEDPSQKLLESANADCKTNSKTAKAAEGSQLPALKPADNALLDEIEHAHFNYFVDQSDPVTGLTKDRSTKDSAASIAAVGFSLTSYPIAAERGWVSREEASDYTLKTLKTLWNAPQGQQAQGEGGSHGFFYHFLDPKTGTRMWNSELSTIDTALLMSGVLFAKDYFNGNSKEETEIRDLADKLYKRVDWTYMLNSDNRVSMGWLPESGFIKSDWQGYNEAMILELLGMGSPTHPLPASVWQKYHDTDTVKTYGGQTYIDFPPQFGHQYSEAWVDFRGIMDAKNKSLGFDYFENSRRATLAQNYYADQNPAGFRGYSKLDWGLTASDGPGPNFAPSSATDKPSTAVQGLGLFAPRVARLDDSADSKPSASAYEKRTGRRPDPPGGSQSNPFEFKSSLAPKPSSGFAPRAQTFLEPRDAAPQPPKFLSYSARGAPDYIDDGTIAPTAAASSIVFAPELVLPTLQHWRSDRPEIWSQDGFKDAFNPTADPKKNSGWVDTDTIGIDQGPIVLMTENYRTGFVWNTIKKDPYITEGLRKAGFTGSWLDKLPTN